MRTGIGLGIVGAVLLGFVCQASFSAGRGTPIKAIEQLLSQDAKTRITAVDDLLAERQGTITNLIALIQDKSPNSQWLFWDSSENLAIRVLGEMRAVEAVPALVKWATPPAGGFKNVSAQIGPGTSPAAQALVKIGKPAERALLEVAKQSPQKMIWSISLSILQKIEGPKCLEVILVDAIAKETEAAAKANLQEGLKRLQSGAGFYPSTKSEITEPKA